MSDYISRDEAIEKIRYEGVYGSGYSDKEREDNVVDMIESIPAADVKPVVRGKWIYDGDCLICSHCRTAYAFSGSNYCPECGAYMREG